MEFSVQNFKRKRVPGDETTEDSDREKKKLQTELDKELLITTIKEVQAYRAAKTERTRKKRMKSIQKLLDMNAQVASIKFGSVIWNLRFQSESALNKFEDVYKSGEMTKMLQEDFVTEEFLDRHSLKSAEMKVDVNEEYIKACRERIGPRLFHDWVGLKIPNKLKIIET